jgi:hypothetical protein
MHELTHSNGVCCHADRFTLDDYRDSFCVMGASRGARGFVDQTLLLPGIPQGADYHALAGPGICTPYLLEAGWLDVVANTTALPANPVSGTSFVLDANQGAPPFGSESQVALTLGSTPTKATDPAQYWIEYRYPIVFDSAINRPNPRANFDLPSAGVLIARKVQIFNQWRCSGSLHSFLQASVGTSIGNTLTITAGYTLQIANLDPAQKRIQVTIL